MELIYTVDANVEEPIMLIDKHIGMDSEDGAGIMGDQFQKELLFLDTLGKKRIQIWINSPGGVVMDGYNIYNAILRTKTKVDTYCTGIAASIAAVIFQAGRNRCMSDYGLLMYHNPYGGEDSASNNEELDKIKSSIVKMISTRCGKTDEEVSAIMDRTTWITATEALEQKMCDEIHSSDEYNRPRIAKTDTVKQAWSTANKILNKLTEPQMEKVTNKLGLNKAANEESIVTALETIMNSSSEKDEKIKKMEAEVTEAKSKYDKLKEDFDKMKNEADEATKAKNASEVEETKNKAKDLIKNAIKLGKITNEAKTVELWEGKAVADLAGTTALLETMTKNKKSPDVEAGKEGEAKLGSVIAQYQADKRNSMKIN